MIHIVLSNMSVINLSEVDSRSSTWTTEDMLKNELEKVKDGKGGNKCICIHLDDIDGSYGIGYGSAGFHKMTEIIALFECLKVQIIKEDMELI